MGTPPILRSRSATTKVTEAEYTHLESLAAASGMNLSEWIRSRLLGRGAESAAADEVLLGEVLALRTILMNMLFAVANGKPVTPEQMREWIEKADGDKARKATERMTAVVARSEPSNR